MSKLLEEDERGCRGPARPGHHGANVKGDRSSASPLRGAGNRHHAAEPMHLLQRRDASSSTHGSDERQLMAQAPRT